MKATLGNVSALAAQRLREKPEATWCEGKSTVALVGNGGQFVRVAYASKTEFGLTLMRGPEHRTAYITTENNELVSSGGRPEEILDVATHGWHFYQPGRYFGYIHEAKVVAIFWTELHDSQSNSVHTLTAFQFVARRQRTPQALRLHDGDSQAWMGRFWTGLDTGIIVDMTERLANSGGWLHSDGESKVWLEFDPSQDAPYLQETYDLWYAQDKMPDTASASKWGEGRWQTFNQ